MNPDTLAYVVAAVAVPLFGFLGIIANGVFKNRLEANKKLTDIRASTERLEARLSRVEGKMINHFEWHVREKRK